MGKTRVLWIDHYYQDGVINLKEANLELIYPGTTARLVNTYNKLVSLASSGDLERFDVLVAHMSFNGLTDFVLRWQEDLLNLRFGVLTDEKICVEVETDVIRELSPDFLANFDDDDFIKEQFAKERITKSEREFRGKAVLTAVADIDREGKSTGGVRHEIFMPRKTIRREREGD